MQCPTPLILHIPHSSLHFPPEALVDFTAPITELRRQAALLTDHFTDELFAPPSPDGVAIIHDVNRLVVDPERFEDDQEEPMAARGQGVLYERGADGTMLRPALSVERRAELLSQWYWPHHRRLSEAVARALNAAGRALIIDAHSFPSQPLPVDIDQRSPRPDLCLGKTALHTPPALVERAAALAEAMNWQVGIDWPYAGSIVPLEHLDRTPAVMSIMIEVNRDRYMRLEGNRAVRTAGFEATKRFVHSLVAALREAAG